ncbi:MAG: ATP phosphoribosyltransferase regulatory subunit [Planctomycetes bacterium]|nr:ATP phosphoribosyltransferase regulatory subunit [Planctomycetota bacterium]
MGAPLARVPAGVQYVFGAEARLRRAVERRVLEVFGGWSYEEVLLPTFDYAELFEGGLGQGRARTYRFTDHQGELLALRPELTTLVARTVATRLEDEPLPLRLAYSGEVFRFDPPRRGRHAEFHQVGLEHLGTDRLEADLEVLLVCAEALRALGVEGARLVLGHVGFLGGIVDALDLPRDAREDLRERLDRRDPDAVAEALRGRADPERAAELARLTTLTGKADVLDAALALVKNPVSRAAALELHRVLATARAAGHDALEVDLGGVAGFDYYTGMTFQVFVPGLASALGGGGRYDRLMAQFGRDLPAVGFSLCLDWLADVVARAGGAARLAPAPAAEALAGDDLAALFRRAAALRAEGRRVRIDHAARGAAG